MLAVVGLAAALVLRQWRADLLPLVRIAVTVSLATLLIGSAEPLLTLLSSLGVGAGGSTHVTVLVKGLGIAMLTQITAGICRDCGESGIAEGVELAGRLAILLLCLPLCEELLEAARRLFSIGGEG